MALGRSVAISIDNWVDYKTKQTNILASDSSTRFILSVRVWDPHSLQFTLDGHLFFEANRP